MLAELVLNAASTVSPSDTAYLHCNTNSMMPTETDRQIAADALRQGFLVILITTAEAQVYEEGSDSDNDSSMGSTRSSSSSSSDKEVLPPSQAYLDGMGELYSRISKPLSKMAHS